MKYWKLLLAVPVVAALAMVPQDPSRAGGAGDPSLDDIAHVLPISELQYVTRQGQTTVVSARNVVEIRLIDDLPEGIRLELYYDNGDYSLIDAQAFHLLRAGQSTREVKLVRGKQSRMRFPQGIR
ncbi:MAG: hypothetical protein KDE27_17905 [Planctomycetes bacterium]|nr:hypothetical protein [Planctomycetota bacterium]